MSADLSSIAVITFRTANGEVSVMPEAVISLQKTVSGTLLRMDTGASVIVIEPFDSVIAKIEQATGE